MSAVERVRWSLDADLRPALPKPYIPIPAMWTLPPYLRPQTVRVYTAVGWMEASL